MKNKISLVGFPHILGFVSPADISTNKALFTSEKWLAHGIMGTWSAMIFVLFSYGGIEVMELLSTELKDHREIGKAIKVMTLSLTLIYTLYAAIYGFIDKTKRGKCFT